MSTTARQSNNYTASRDEVIRELPKACSDERAAVEFFEAQRWPNGAFCPVCASVDVYQMRDTATGERQANYRWRCRDCKKQFTVRVGTIMEDSPVKLSAWAFAFWQACAGKKGVSAKQIERQTGVSYKTALYMLHRIRWAMVETCGEPLNGSVEVDETYVGGKPRPVTKGQRAKAEREGVEIHRPRGLGRGKHTAIVAMVEKNEGDKPGRVRTRVVANVTADNVERVMREYVAETARIDTDELALYPRATRTFAGHRTVRHREDEYVGKDGATTNNAESFFSRMKRSVFGIHHKVSREHLHRYATHMEFLHNTRRMMDGERIGECIRMSVGKRLTQRAVA